MRLLLIHGVGCGAADWSAQVDTLGGMAKVVAPDLPGHGDAPGLANPSIAAFAAVLNRERRRARRADDPGGA